MAHLAIGGELRREEAIAFRQRAIAINGVRLLSRLRNFITSHLQKLSHRLSPLNTSINQLFSQALALLTQPGLCVAKS